MMMMMMMIATVGDNDGEVSRRKNYDMNDECHKDEFLVLCAQLRISCVTLFIVIT